MAVVYWIRLNSYTDPKKQGYIGVSENPDKRLHEHFLKAKRDIHENPNLGRHIKKYESEIIVDILLEDKKEKCLTLEAELRPEKYIGWNIAAGGGQPPINIGHTWNRGRKGSKGQSDNMKRIRSIYVYTGAQLKGFSWWNNGIENVMSKESPGVDYVKGRLGYWWTDGVKNKFQLESPGLSWRRGRINLKRK